MTRFPWRAVTTTLNPRVNDRWREKMQPGRVSWNEENWFWLLPPSERPSVISVHVCWLKYSQLRPSLITAPWSWRFKLKSVTADDKMPSVHAGMQRANYTTGINRTDTTFLKHLISLLFVIILINEAVKNNNKESDKSSGGCRQCVLHHRRAAWSAWLVIAVIIVVGFS